MKKTIYSIYLIIGLCAIAFSAWGQVNQPVYGQNITVQVTDLQKFYDMGGSANTAPDCQETDMINDCWSKVTLCSGGNIVCVTFNSMTFNAGGYDNLIVRDGDALGNILGNTTLNASGIFPDGTTFTSSAPSGCLTFEFHANSIGLAGDWDATIRVKTTGRDDNSPPCNLVCNDHVNASMPASPGINQGGCMKTFYAEDFLQNPSNCTYTVELSYPYGTNNPSQTVGNVKQKNAVDRSQLGYTFVYSVKAPDGNSCWGYVTVEDKAPPQAFCWNRDITCYQVGIINDERFLNQIVDNCGEPGASKIERLTFKTLGTGCDSVYIAKVYRTIRTWDNWGNTGTCDDTLSVTRDSLKNIKCADLVAAECYVECTFTNNSNKSVTLKINFSTDVNLVFDKTATLNLAEGMYDVKYYPTPEFLLFIKSCVTVTDSDPKDGLTLIVPYIKDKVWYPVVNPTSGTVTCESRDSCVPMYPNGRTGLCKTTIGYWDKPLSICGENGFKIRREWRIADWCTGRDTVCVQYIKVEDTKAPVYRTKDGTQLDVAGNKILTIRGVASAHDCYATVSLPEPGVKDCNKVDHSYIIHYQDAGHPGKEVVLSGALPGSVKLPASSYGGCYTVDVRSVDKCYHDTTTTFTVCIEDITPPTPICIEYTQTTVDPATCWARVYAQDLDQGSRDNCCNVLHFAVAHMDSIDYYTNAWTSYWNTTCSADYWKYKDKYDKFLSDYINCFVFKDYIDLTECGTNQVVLRVYEACGVPRYDPHIFPCSEHDWYTYNTTKLCRAWHNYTFFHKDGKKTCTAKPTPTWCRTDWEAWMTKAQDASKYKGGFPTNTPGSRGNNCNARSTQLFNTFYIGGTDGCAIDYLSDCVFYFPRIVVPNGTEAYAPGNRCSDFLYNDCMVNILVDDKTPPVCERPDDIFWYCDGVSDTEGG
ncbi:MAG: hypothetical protein WBC35_07600, partial [Saprospiraceae bacterium]